VRSTLRAVPANGDCPFFPPVRRLVVVAGLLLAAGCARPALPDPGAPLADREVWEVFSIDGVRVGYGKTAISHPKRDGRALMRIEGLNHLVVKRFGQPAEQDIRFTSLETNEGELIEFDSELAMGQHAAGAPPGAWTATG